jgi:hypothetical protein
LRHDCGYGNVQQPQMPTTAIYQQLPTGAKLPSPPWIVKMN